MTKKYFFEDLCTKASLVSLHNPYILFGFIPISDDMTDNFFIGITLTKINCLKCKNMPIPNNHQINLCFKHFNLLQTINKLIEKK